MNSELNGIRHRRQLALHAIGDGAVRQFLDALDTFKKDIQVVMTITGGRIVFRNDLETGHD